LDDPQNTRNLVERETAGSCSCQPEGGSPLWFPVSQLRCFCYSFILLLNWEIFFRFFKKLFLGADIYDALGNMIAQLKQFKDHKSSSIVKYNWDGKNMKGRLVGDGTYMAVIKVKGGETVRKMVGVKNECMLTVNGVFHPHSA
jgi:hypothetical protein